jgi:hypothetical protein
MVCSHPFGGGPANGDGHVPPPATSGGGRGWRVATPKHRQPPLCFIYFFNKKTIIFLIKKQLFLFLLDFIFFYCNRHMSSSY